MFIFNGRSARKVQSVPRLLNSSKWCLGLLLVFGAPPALAATITVNTIADNTIAGDGKCTLREALINVHSRNDRTEGDCVESSVSANTIEFEVSLAFQSIELNGEALPSIVRPVTIAGPVEGNPLGISINAANGSRIFNIETNSTPIELIVELADMTLTNGHVDGDNEVGGAVRALSELRMMNVVVRDSSTAGASGNGGGIYSEAPLVITGSEIRDNWTSGRRAHGGGIAARGSTRVADSVVKSNETRGENAAGGGIGSSGDLHITRTQIIENQSIEGRVSALSTSNLQLEDSVVAGNSGGAAVSATEGEIIGTEISDNLGTGVYFLEAGLIDSSTISRNVGGRGGVHIGVPISLGGLHAVGKVSIRNSTISGNHSAEGGGGINMGWYPPGRGQVGGELHMLHTTLLNNRSDTGEDGVYGYGEDMEFSAHNSIVAPGNGTACNVTIDNGANNLVTDTTCGTEVTALNSIGLGGLGNNGGLTPTHALSADSVALDAAGDCISEHGIEADQRGSPRPAGPACDIGAVEGTGPLPMPAGSWPAWLALLLAIVGPAVWRHRSATRLGAG